MFCVGAPLALSFVPSVVRSRVVVGGGGESDILLQAVSYLSIVYSLGIGAV